MIPVDYGMRIRKVQAACRDADVQAYVATRQASLSFLTGAFAPWRTACIVPAIGEPALVCWERDASRVRLETWISDVTEYGSSSSFITAIADRLAGASLRSSKVAFDIGSGGAAQVAPGNVGAAEYIALRGQMPELDIVDATPLIESILMVKEPAELERLRKAALAADAGFHAACAAIRPGVTECEIAGVVESAIRGEGSTWAWSVTAGTEVAFGPRTAYSKGVTQPATERKAEAGDMVIVDIHSMYDLYLADLACNLCLGRPSADQRKLADAWERGVDFLLRSLKAGESVRDVSERTWALMEGQGYGDFTLKAFGHGLGTCARIPPYINPLSNQVLEDDMTIAAGFHLYQPGVGGMRLELPAVIRSTGAEPLSDVPRVLHVIDV